MIEVALNDEIIRKFNYEIEYGLDSKNFYKNSHIDTSINIPANYNFNNKNYIIKKIGKEVFSHCHKLETIIIPETIVKIEDLAFCLASNLKKIDIPNNVISIGKAAFCNYVSLSEVKLSNNVTQILDYAFSDCKSLTSVNIPDSVKSIGYRAFASSKSLTISISKNCSVYHLV